ncbi:MAG TPA: hypothetical protein VF148_09120 [Acidimicrobiia bacterium]
MTRRIDPREAAMVVAELRAANPVRRGAGPQTPDQVDAFLLHVMERTDMVQDITRRVGAPQGGPKSGRQMLRWLGFAAGFAFAALIAIPVLLLNRGPADPALESLSAPQVHVIEDVVEAVNSEDFDAFRALFAPGGSVAFETGLSRPYHQGVAGGQPIPVTDEAGFEADFAWGAALDRRVTLRSCESESDRIFQCDVTSSLEAYRTEWVETLGIGLAEEGGIFLLFTEPLDVDPVDREQPLSLLEYLDHFDRWLEENHPDEFQRLVRPGTPGEISGVETPLDPDLVDELTALIDEYAASR